MHNQPFRKKESAKSAVSIRGNSGLIHWASLVFTVTNSLVMLLVPLYSIHLDYSILGIGILAALPSLVQVLSRLAVGRLSDQYGDTRMLRISCLVYLLGPVSLLASPYFGLAAIVVAQIATGAGRAIFWTVSKTYATKLPTGAGGRNISVFNAASNAGKLVGMAVTGTLVVLIGYPGTFAAVLVLAVFQAGLTFLLLPLHQPVGGRFDPGILLQFLPRELNLMSLSVAGYHSFVGAIPIAAASSFFPVYLGQVGWGEQITSLLTSLVIVGTLLASAWASSRLEATDLRRVGLVSSVATGLGVAALPAFQDWWLLALLFLVTGFFSGLSNLMSQLQVSRSSPPESRGAAMAFATLFWSLGLLVIPFCVGLIATWVSLSATAVGTGLFFALTGLFVSVSERRLANARPEEAMAMTPSGARSR